MKLKIIPDTNIKYIEIIGVGENISDNKQRVYFSKSGNNVIKDMTTISNDVLNMLELYFSKKNKAVLTVKKNKKKITFNDTVNSSYRGTSWIEEIKNGIIISATGNGRISEHTEFIATLEENGYLIIGFNGRYKAGYKIYKNKEGKLIKNTFANEDKYVDMFDIEEAKALAGLNEICDIVKTDESNDILKLLKNKFDTVEVEDSCGKTIYKTKIDNLIITISKVEVINEN